MDKTLLVSFRHPQTMLTGWPIAVSTNKHGPDGGLLIPDKKALDFENTLSQIAFSFFFWRRFTDPGQRVTGLHGTPLRP